MNSQPDPLGLRGRTIDGKAAAGALAPLVAAALRSLTDEQLRALLRRYAEIDAAREPGLISDQH